MLATSIGLLPTPVEGASTLSAINIDPEAAADAYRHRVIDPLRGVLPDDAIAKMEEQLAGACTTEIAAFDRFAALIAGGGEGDRFADTTAIAGRHQQQVLLANKHALVSELAARARGCAPRLRKRRRACG